MTDKDKVWERRTNESTKEYEAFLIYLELGPRRSQAKTAKKLGISQRQVARYSVDNGWSARVLVWDDRFQASKLEEVKDQLVEGRELLVSSVVQVVKSLCDIAIGRKTALPGQVAAINSLLDRAGLVEQQTEDKGAVTIVLGEPVLSKHYSDGDSTL